MTRVTTALVDDAPIRRPIDPSRDSDVLRRTALCGALPSGRGGSRRGRPEKLVGRFGCGSARFRRMRRFPA